ncbi:glutaredoxin family protein, partial [Patescibacteria group bacterium]
MNIRLKHIFTSFFILLALFLATSKSYAEEECSVNAYFFYSNTCPHCHEEQKFLDSIKNKYENLVVHELEISENRKNLESFIKVGNELGIRTGAVPFFIIGDEYVIGYGADETTGVEIEKLIKGSLENPPEDIVSNFHQCELTETQETTSSEDVRKSTSEVLKIPFFGKVDVAKLSLPALTFVIALLD